MLAWRDCGTAASHWHLPCAWASAFSRRTAPRPNSAHPCQWAWVAAGLARSNGAPISESCGAVPWFPPRHSGVAQWLTCWAHNPKVRGSKPRSAIYCHIPTRSADPLNACRAHSAMATISVSQLSWLVAGLLRAVGLPSLWVFATRGVSHRMPFKAKRLHFALCARCWNPTCLALTYSL